MKTEPAAETITPVPENLRDGKPAIQKAIELRQVKREASNQNKKNAKDDLTSRVLKLAELDDDAIDLNFASIAKRMRSNLTADQQEDFMDEVNVLFSQHLRNARKAKQGQGQVQGQGDGNFAVPSTSHQSTNNNMIQGGNNMQPPPLQRIPEGAHQQQQPQQPPTFFDTMTNNTYYSY